MKTRAPVPRRHVLKLAAGGGSALVARQWAAFARGDAPSEQIRIGVIGVGVRGKYLIGNLPPEGKVVAVCDCDLSRMAETLKPNEKRFAEVLAAFCERDANRCATYQDYRQMIGRERLDAVIIAAPDHHHVQAAMEALDAGLDVYVEKPLSVAIREGRLLADQVQKTGRILQVGSQQRTMVINRFACEFIREGGLGRIDHVDFPNFPGPLSSATYPEQPAPKDLDWNLFLGPTPQRPHHSKLRVKDEFKVGSLLWRGWDLHRQFSGHLMTNWGAHSIDMVQYALDEDNSGPVSITVEHGFDEDVLRQDWQQKWHKKSPRPSGLFQAENRLRPVTATYANGTSLRLRPGVNAATFYGEHGRMVISRNRFRADPPDLVQNGPDPKVAQRWIGSGFVARPHLQDWLDCIRSRRQPNAPVEVGHRTATVCHLINLARELDRLLRWDPLTERFADDPDADNHLVRARRPGWRLP